MATTKPGKPRSSSRKPRAAAAVAAPVEGAVETHLEAGEDDNPYGGASAVTQASEDAGLGRRIMATATAEQLAHHPWTPFPYEPNEQTYRCISFDGGPNTLSYLHCLLALELRKPGFLNRTQVFAGTSDGAFAAAFLASQTQIGTTELLRCIEMIEKILTEAIAPNRLESISQRLTSLVLAATNRWERTQVERYVDSRARALSSVGGIARLASGVSTWASHDEIAAILKEYIGDERWKLGDTPRDLVIVTYAVQAPNAAAVKGSSNRKGIPSFVQRPKVYQNIDRRDDDCQMPVIEAAMRSAALPMFMPIHERHVDGAVFANNPAMCAVAAAVAKRSHRKDDTVWYLKDLVMLSMGSDDGSLGGEAVNEELSVGDQHRWGWAKWAFHGAFRGMKDLMLILDVLLNSDAAGVNYQAAQLLGRRYLRVAPPGRTRTVDKFMSVLSGDVRGLIDTAMNTAIAWDAEASLESGEYSDAEELEKSLRAERRKLAEGLSEAGLDEDMQDAIMGSYLAAVGWLPDVLARIQAQAIALGNTQSICAAMRWADEVWMPGPQPRVRGVEERS